MPDVDDSNHRFEDRSFATSIDVSLRLNVVGLMSGAALLHLKLADI
jgi:hypothetical protein